MKVSRTMLELILSGFIGIFLGVGGTLLATKKPPKAPEEVAVKQQEIIHQLTDFDLTIPICKPEYIKEKGDLLCRELTCLQFTRGIDSKTSGASCESISNVSNKKAIIEHCKVFDNEEQRKECLELYWRRN